MLSKTLIVGRGAGRPRTMASLPSRSAFTNRDTATAISGSESVETIECWYIDYPSFHNKSDPRVPNHRTQPSANHGKHRPSHDATARASEQSTHYARTSAPHGRGPSTSQSPPRTTPTAASLNTLTNRLPSASRWAKATSTRRSPVHKPRCSRPSDHR